MAVIITDTPRRANDFYPTPHGLCERSLTILPSDFIPDTIVDAGAGSGRWGLFAKEKYNNSILVGIDLVKRERHPSYDRWLTADYLELNDTENEIDLIIGNPPYCFAEEFVIKSIFNSRYYVLFLLKLDFLTTEKRRIGLWNEFPPKEVWICSRRPGFNTPINRNTDSNSYAIYLWENGYYGEPTIKWLDWNYNKDLDYE